MIDLDTFNSIKSAAETNTRIFTPQKIVREMLDALPPEVWNSKSTFLDPAVKSGIFPVEIFNKLMESPEVIKDFPDQQARKVHILKNQIIGIAIDKLSCLTAQRNLYGFINSNGNIRSIENYMDLVKNKNSKYYLEAVQKEFNNMQFDVIIGNPPYQSKTASIYQHFIDKAISLDSRHIAMIVKNNWTMSDTLKETRDRMINRGIVKVVNYPIVGELFPDVGVAVNIFYIQKDYAEDTKFVEVQNGKIIQEYKVNVKQLPVLLNNRIELSVVSKLLRDLKKGNFGQYSLPTEPFRITSTFMVGRSLSAYELDHSVVETEYFNVKVACMDGRDLDFEYINENDVPSRNELVDVYKIISGGRFNNNQTVISNLHLLENMSVCTSSWAVLFYHKNKEYACNALSYIQTRFFRFLVLLLCDSGMTNMSPYRLSLVPIQDFSHPWTDEMLYKKYSLTEEEIAYIEATIKPM